jgi:hypothetical protein
MSTVHLPKFNVMSGLGDAAKLKPLEVELKRLEDLSESIVQDFAYMRQREVRLLFIFPLGNRNNLARACMRKSRVAK